MAREDNNPVLLLAERFWQGDPEVISKDAVSPLHNPMTELVQLQPGLAFIMTFANVSAIDTSEGLVLIDCASPMFGRPMFDAVREWTSSRLHSCIYTHGHVDHVFGVGHFDAEAEEAGWPRPRVVAHEALPLRFDRYKETLGYNTCINERQFQVKGVPWPSEYRYPDLTYRDTLTLKIGEEVFELHHDRGETDDATWVYLPNRGVLCTGDMVIWACPNCGNPQKVQRYPRDWAAALLKMDELGASILLPGHGPPVIGRDRVRAVLRDSAALLNNLVDQTLAAMNAGLSRNAVMKSIKLPKKLLKKPYLRPVYDDPMFIVANLWRLYGGWYDGNPASLKEPPAAAMGAALSQLAGGPGSLASYAVRMAQSGKLRVAASLIQHASEAVRAPDPAYLTVHRARELIFRHLEGIETSLMAKSIYRAAKLDSVAIIETNVPATILELVQSLTLPQKVAQLHGIWAYDLMTSRKVKPSDKPVRVFSATAAAALLADGVGHIARAGGSTVLTPGELAAFHNDLQAWLVEHAPQGIGAIVHEECCAGPGCLGATQFPQPINLAATWNPVLAHHVGAECCRQLRAIGTTQALAPVLDVARDPRWGRVEETFGEDPGLIAAMGTSFIRGLQGATTDGDAHRLAVAATAKHYAGYGATMGGRNASPVTAGLREVRQVFDKPFHAAVAGAKLAAVMPTYSEHDGLPVHGDIAALTGRLRGDIGFSGVIVSDYYGVRYLQTSPTTAIAEAAHGISGTPTKAAITALTAGVDVELPAKLCFQELVSAVETGQLDESFVDAAVCRVLTLKQQLGLLQPAPVATPLDCASTDTPAGVSLAKSAALQSMVLLHNEADALPLRAVQRIAVIGGAAASGRILMGAYSHLGQLEIEGINTADLAPSFTIWNAIKAVCATATFAAGYEVGHDAAADKTLETEAVAAVQGADAVVVVVGTVSGQVMSASCGEFRDSHTLELPAAQQHLLARLRASTRSPIVLVLVSGRPLVVPDVYQGLLWAGIPGPQGPAAIADVLFGVASPCGRLPISFPRHVGTLPMFARSAPTGQKSFVWGPYVEGESLPLFPFGHGLQYTSLEYHACSVTLDGKHIHVSAQLRNVGRRAGVEVVQVYGQLQHRSVTQPVCDLIGFGRVAVDADATCAVECRIPVQVFAYLNDVNRWCVEAGPIVVSIGKSCANVVHTQELSLTRSLYFRNRPISTPVKVAVSAQAKL